MTYFTSPSDCLTKTQAAALTIQKGYIYMAGYSSLGDLSTSSALAQEAAVAAETALGLPSGTYSNPLGLDGDPCS